MVRCGQFETGDDVLELIQTAGDLKEPILAKTIGYKASTSSGGLARGIFVGGTIEQPIVATDSVYLASIIGSTFAPGADITIGCHLKGRIEATDSEAGVIRSVSVGHGAPGGSHDYAMNGWSVADGDPESVIRAQHIEAVDIAWMERNSKVSAPRIQTDWIGSLNVDRMTHGEVVGYAGPLAPEAAPTRANYARIDQATFGQVNQGWTREDENGQHTSRIWCREFETFAIEEGNAGELRFVEIPENRSLQIGDGMRGLLDDGGSTGVYVPGLITIDAARLSVPEAPGLHGCIVLNASNAPNPDPELFGAGDIRVYHSPEGYYEFNGTTASAEFKLPDYGHTSPSLGGGSIGLVPFTLQWQDCDQVGTQAQPARYLDSEFDRFLTDAGYPNGAKLRFYGPVTRPESPTLPPLGVFALVNGAEVPIDSNVVFDIGSTSEPATTRSIALHSTPAAPLMPGSYVVKLDEESSLLCDALLVTQEQSIREFEPYYFDILEDCNRNHRADHVPWGTFTIAEIDETQTINGVLYRTHDFDDNDRLDVCQFFVDEYCPADFNMDGGIDGSDLELFFILWEWAIDRADINQDGGVDGADIASFFFIWEAGHC